MGAFDAMDIAATGANVTQDWMDVLAHNLANVNTVLPPDQEPFRASMIYATERIGGPGVAGSGVQAVSLLQSQAEPVKVFDPDHPHADEEGNVTLPVVDMAAHMADLIVAQRSYQMNLQVIRNAEEAYQNALRIGSR